MSNSDIEHLIAMIMNQRQFELQMFKALRYSRHTRKMWFA